jgi:hypothetical protein
MAPGDMQGDVLQRAAELGVADGLAAGHLSIEDLAARACRPTLHTCFGS